MKYPSRNGLALHPQELGLEVVEAQRRVTNNHHRYYPRRNYDTQLRHLFRGLSTHVHTMWIPEHATLHEDYSPPLLPRPFQMIEVLDEYVALNGILDIVREHKTNETYQISANQWQRIRNGAN